MNQSKILVEVCNITQITPSIKKFDFIPVKGSLDAFSAGSHITVHMGDSGINRAYSLISDPENPYKYSIAVLREEQSRGGSSYMHNNVNEGDQLQISKADNFFPLVQDKNAKQILIAGGIGITPFLSYLYYLEANNFNYELHYCYREVSNTGFISQLKESLGEHLHTYDKSLKQRFSVRNLLLNHNGNSHFYVCGPQSLIDEVTQLGKEFHIEDHVHSENFGELVTSGSEFEVYFEKSGFGLQVGKDSTILQAIEADGRLNIECLCRNGVCGTCETSIVEGAAEHHDSYLDEEEKEAQETMMICVSRAKGKKITLDL